MLNSNEMVNSITLFSNSTFDNNRKGIDFAIKHINDIFENIAKKAHLNKMTPCKHKKKH